MRFTRVTRMGWIALLLFGAIAAHGADPFQYVSPKPGSILNARETNIILRPGDMIDPFGLDESILDVVGSESGPHTGELLLSDDGRTVVFNPHTRFLPNETVTVSLRSGLKTTLGEEVQSISFAFAITPLDEPIPPDDDAQDRGRAKTVAMSDIADLSDDALPEDFPEFIITGTGETAPGLLFGGNTSEVDGIGSYNMIIDNSGTPVYYEPQMGRGFRLQPNGLISYAKPLGGRHRHIYMIEDSDYAVIDSFQMGNGYIADSHDFTAIPVLVFGLIFAVILRIVGGSETRWEHLSVPFVFQSGGFSSGGNRMSIGGSSIQRGSRWI